MYIIVTESRNTGSGKGWGTGTSSCLLYFEWNAMFLLLSKEVKVH